MRIILQTILFILGCFMMWLSGADGTWETFNNITLVGMIMCLIGITLGYVITLILKILEKE